MMRNLVIGFALLIAVVGIAIAPVHAADADADLSSMIEEYKNKTQIDVNIKDQGIAGVDIDISYYLFDENGLPVKLNKTVVGISITTIETGYYGLKDHFAHAYVGICADVYEYYIGDAPYGSIKNVKQWDETKEMIVPVKREDGVIELRSMNVDVQHIHFRVTYFDSALGGHYIRSSGDPVSVHVVIYVIGQKYPVSTVKQYVRK